MTEGPTQLRLLLVEDSEPDAELLVRHLRRSGFDVAHERVETQEGMSEALGSREWDLVISDYSMPRFSGTAAFSVLKESGEDVPFIFVSGTLGEETAVEAMRLGVRDYFIKGKLERLVPAVQRELREARERRRRRQAEDALRRAEQQLRQAQKMEAIGRLAGGVAHDFNNLLAVIIGYCDFLRDKIEEGNPLREDVNEIKKAGQRAVALTRQLLAFSRQQVMEPQLFDLNGVVDDLAAMLRRLIGSDIELVVILAPGLGRVKADPGQIGQVIMNLAVNARDAMPKGGSLILETAGVELERDDPRAPGAAPGPYVLLAVSDTGQGMDADTLSRLFEPFFTTKERGKGTGLGLSISYGIVKQSGGHIAVESELGRGTAFRVYLPQADPPS